MNSEKHREKLSIEEAFYKMMSEMFSIKAELSNLKRKVEQIEKRIAVEEIGENKTG